MSEGLFLVCMVGGMFAALGGILAYAVRKNREREAIWRVFAESRGGTFRPSHGFLGSQAASIELVVSGAPVLVDSYVVSTGKSSTTFTRARASYVLGDGPVFLVYREGLLSSLGKALGTQDVELGGHAQFDRVFMVKCDAPEAVRRLWTTPLRDTLCARLEDANVSADGGTVTVIVVGAVDDHARLGALAEIAGGLASQGLASFAALSELPGARYTSPAGPWDARSRPRLELDARGVAMTLDARSTDEGVCVELVAKAERALPVIAASIDESGAVTGEVPPGLLPVASELALLGPCSLSSAQSSLRLRFPPGTAPSRAAAEAAVELLRSLARAPGDAFR